jgi:hypothetical protein
VRKPRIQNHRKTKRDSHPPTLQDHIRRFNIRKRRKRHQRRTIHPTSNQDGRCINIFHSSPSKTPSDQVGRYYETPKRSNWFAHSSGEDRSSGADVMDTVGFALIHPGPKKERNCSATGSGFPVTSLHCHS